MRGAQQVRAIVKAYGDVQRVGYRFVVQDLARKMGVKGYVKNLPDGSVEIVAEASKETIDKFVNAVKFRQPPIDVAKLDVVYAEATSKYQHFNLLAGDLTEEIVEGFGTGLKYINLSREETKQGLKNIETTANLSRNETKQGFNKVEKSITSMHTDLKEMHTDLKGSIDSMHNDMNQHFGEMAKRYDATSRELIRTRKELTRAVDNMSRLIDEFIKGRGKRS